MLQEFLCIRSGRKMQVGGKSWQAFSVFRLGMAAVNEPGIRKKTFTEQYCTVCEA